MKVTEVFNTEARWGRDAYIKLIDDKVVFDCSDEEYGPIELPIELLKQAIEEHQSKHTGTIEPE
jgi:hypothetical protein